MLSIVFVMHNNVISNSNDSFTANEELIHHPLEDVLGAGKSKGKHTNLYHPYGILNIMRSEDL